jgi:AcrR family transcriptional regulator
VKTRDLARTRAEILQAAFMEVFQNGFQGTSVDAIVSKTKVTKGAFFHQFPTKMELGYALVDEVIKPMIIDRWVAPLEKFENPVEGILHQMQTLIGGSPPEHLKLGCPLNNLVQEMAPVDLGFKKRLQAALNLWIDETERHLVRARKNGHLRKGVNTREAAHFIVMAHEGFYGLIKGLDDPRAFKTLYSSLKTYLRSLEA